MNSQTRYEIRFGLIALALSGLLFTLGGPVRGPNNLDLGDPASFIIWAAAPNYVPSWVMALVAGMLQLYGLLGLYRYLTYRADSLIALLACVLGVAGIALGLPLFTFFAVTGPVIADLYQQGNQAVMAVVEAFLISPLGLALLAISIASGIGGTILFAIAVWRNRRLPRWTGVFFVLSYVLLGLPITWATELLGAVLLLISTSVMAWKGWQESAASNNGRTND